MGFPKIYTPPNSILSQLLSPNKGKNKGKLFNMPHSRYRFRKSITLFSHNALVPLNRSLVKVENITHSIPVDFIRPIFVFF